MLDVQSGVFTQAELSAITGLNTVTVDTWLIRGILQTTKVGGRTLRGRRLFSVLAIFEAAVIGELVKSLAMGPSEAAKIARCAAADWNTPDDWKPRVIAAAEKTATKVARVFLVIVRSEDRWLTVPVYGSKDGAPVFGPSSKYERWFANAVGVLPASDLLSSVYVKCKKIAADGEASVG
jgi:hypothetical protein